MDTIQAFAMGRAATARGAKRRVFDWDKAAAILRERGVKDARAGLSQDMEWTSGTILQDGQVVDRDDTYTFLSSNWATPVLEIAGDEIPCWCYEDEANGWGSRTYWPESARRIFRGEPA